MKAIVMHEFGSSDVLKMEEMENPKPGAADVTIQLKAAGINYVDIWVRKGIPAYQVKLPHIIGADGAGIVEDVGPEAEGVEPGTRVVIVPAISDGTCSFCRNDRTNQCDRFEILGTKRQGTYAERIVAPDQNVLAIPDQMSFEEAAAFPLAYLTAWHMLIGRAQLKEQETVVVVGAGGGVAAAAVQIAKWKKARVLATTTHANKADRIKALGADDVFVQTAEKKDFSEWVQEKTGRRGADVAVDAVGPATFESTIKSLVKYGRLAFCGTVSGATVPLDLRSVFSRDISLLGARMGTQKEFQDLAEAVFSGGIKPVIDRVFPLSEAAQAQDYLESQQHVGKIVLKID